MHSNLGFILFYQLGFRILDDHRNSIGISWLHPQKSGWENLVIVTGKSTIYKYIYILIYNNIYIIQECCEIPRCVHCFIRLRLASGPLFPKKSSTTPTEVTLFQKSPQKFATRICSCFSKVGRTSRILVGKMSWSPTQGGSQGSRMVQIGTYQKLLVVQEPSWIRKLLVTSMCKLGVEPG